MLKFDFSVCYNAGSYINHGSLVQSVFFSIQGLCDDCGLFLDLLGDILGGRGLMEKKDYFSA